MSMVGSMIGKLYHFCSLHFWLLQLSFWDRHGYLLGFVDSIGWRLVLLMPGQDSRV